jgi:hypothetical protein
VPINRQADVFPATSEWVNLYDPTDPVASRLDAFERPKNAIPPNLAPSSTNAPIYLAPQNFACRSSRLFGLSHIRYFSPRPPGPKTMPAVLAAALTSGGSTTLSNAAAEAQLSMPHRAFRRTLAFVQLGMIGGALTAMAGALLIGLAKLVPNAAVPSIRTALGAVAPRVLACLDAGGISAWVAATALVVTLALCAILAAGVIRMWSDRRFGLVAATVAFVLVAAAASLVLPDREVYPPLAPAAASR